MILASASPRRRELLTQAGLTFSVESVEIDETPLPHEPAAAYVQRLAVEKAQAVAALHRNRRPIPGHEKLSAPQIVLGADTAVVLGDGTILGKPAGRSLAARKQDAARMLGLLSGRTHAVMTGIAAVSSRGESRIVCDVEITHVSVNLISPEEIAAYVESGEPLDKAGAYAIQGYAARWIPRIEGDYSNVVGLPIARVIALLAQFD